MGEMTFHMCACGYGAELYEGSGMAVTNETRTCLHCREIVSVAVALHDEAPLLQADEAPRLGVCPECDRTESLVITPRIGADERLQCPQCGLPLEVHSTGLWD
jgi:hypothetical protein